MRLLGSTLLLLCALSASANRSDLHIIQLHHVTASQVDRLLLSDATGDATASGANLALDSLLRDGSILWTVDPEHNTLVLSGPDAAVRQILEAVARLDVPSRQISLKVERLSGSDAAIRAFKLEARDGRPALTSDNFRVNLAALVAQGQTTVLESNLLTGRTGQPMRVVWTNPNKKRPTIFSVLPRVTGTSLSLSYTSTAERKAADAPATPMTWMLQQMPSGGTAIALLPDGQILLVTATLLPPSPEPVK